MLKGERRFISHESNHGSHLDDGEYKFSFAETFHAEQVDCDDCQ